MDSEAHSVEGNPPCTPEWMVDFATYAEKRESELGHPAPNCPAAAELWRLVEIVKEINTGDEMRTPAQINAYIQALAGISDKWLDPESDPIGARLHPIIEDIIDALRQSLETAMPEGAESLRSWANLRAVKQAAQRTIYRRSLNPSLLNRVWAKLTTRRSKTESQSV